MWYIYTMEYLLLSHKKEWNNATCSKTWMELEVIILSEVSQNKKDKYHDIAYMWNLKYDTNEAIYKTETDSQT